MLSKVRNTALALAALGAIAFGASAIAGAADNGSSKSATPKSGSTATPSQSNSAPRQHPGETLLTGDTAEKVKAAALAKVPGATVIRVETDAEGSPYEAHMRKSDGSEVTVKVDKDFKATSVEDFGGHGGPGGHRGPPPASNGSGTSSSSGASFQGTLQ